MESALEMTRWLRAFVALVENLGSFASIHMVTSITPVPWDPVPSSGFFGYQAYT